MDVVISIILTVLMFSVIIFIHELGHFLMAKLFKVTILEFSIGMGTAIYKRKGKDGVLYAVRAFPIGGYVAMEGEDGPTEQSDNLIADESSEQAEQITEEVQVDTIPEAVTEQATKTEPFCEKKTYQRFLILVAGATMNLILGFIIMFGVFMGQDSNFGTKEIAGFKENSMSDINGLEIGDVITKINGAPIFTDRDIVFELLRDDDGIMDIEVKRDGTKTLLEDVTFQTVENEDGTKQLYIDIIVQGKEGTVPYVAGYTMNNMLSLMRSSVVSLGDMVTGKIGFDQLSGPIGVGQVVNTVAQEADYSSLFLLMSILSISIGVFNLLPIPALDGGRIIFVLAEAITGKKMNPKIEMMVNGIAMAMLFTLMIVIAFKDIFTIFNG